MAYIVSHKVARGWRTSRFRGARSDGRTGRRFRPALVALEDRLVLSFAAPVDYVVGTQTTKGGNGFGPQVATADFNGDGKLDLAVTNTADGTVSILDGNGDGTFQPAVTYDTGLGANNPIWLAAADFSGNGKMDLAIEGNNGEISVMLNNGDGTFAAPTIYTVGLGDRGGLAVGDYFGNGRQDIATAIFSTDTVAILPNNGNGTFGTPVSVAMPAGFTTVRSVATGNFFGNGYADLAVTGGEGYNNTLSPTDPAGVVLFKNDGKGNFTFEAKYLAAVTPDPSGSNGTGDTVNPEHVNAFDLLGNGRPDLVISLYDHNIDVFMNQGNGVFGPAEAYDTEASGWQGGYPRGVVFGDFNGDGIVNIAALNFGEPRPVDQPIPWPGSVGILYGNGDGTFQAPAQYSPFQLPGGLAVGDFNGDGLADLAVTENFTGHAVGVMLNQPGTEEEPPTISQIAPATGPTTGGTVVTITGTNFTGTSEVEFGTIPAAFTVNSDTSITATAPAYAAGTVDVTVYNAGASAWDAADQFTFTDSTSTPAVTAISPAVGSTSGGTSVTITGTDFTGASAVTFGTVAASSFTVESATSIIAVAPAQAAGTVNVCVTTPSGSSPDVSADHYAYQAPTITSITVSPGSATVADGYSQQFSAEAFDQFGNPLAPQPTFTWSVSGLGSINTSGLYKAPASGTGGGTVQASSGTVNAAAYVTVVLPIDTWTGLGTTNNWSDSANWSLKAVPGATSTVQFNGTSKKNATVDSAFGGTVAAVQITSGYTGTITLGQNLTVTGAFTEGGGTYNANGFATNVGGLTTLNAGTYDASTAAQTLTGGLTVAGGTFAGSTGTVSTGNVKISSGTLNAPSTSLVITLGGFTYTGGAFNADNGTVMFTGTHVPLTVTVGTGLIHFYNFTDALAAGSYPKGMTIVGTLTVTGTFSWTSNSSPIYGKIEAQGDVNDENHDAIGNPYLTLDGSANQKIEDLSGVGGGIFRTITVNKTGGTVSLECNPIEFSGVTLTAGTVNTGTYSWVAYGPLSAAAGLNLGNIEIAGSNVTVSSSSLQVANVAFATSGAGFKAPAGNLFVSGNWNDSVGGGFHADGGTVIFNGTGTQSLNSGHASFYNLTIAAGSTLSLQSDVIVLSVFLDLGTLVLNGHKIT